MDFIDLRSDTVTLPSPAMREAIASAALGDDVFGEDPTVNRLQETAAERMGTEAALLVASGTMANLAALLVHCGRGDEVILGDQSHTFRYEAGGISAIGSIHPRTVLNQPDGTLSPEDIEDAIRPDNVHFPRTRLICLENTHNRCFGSALSSDYCDGVVALAQRHGLKVHLDGARVFNAAIALGVDVKELTRGIDSISFCLSKGLSAPVGSLICGTREFIAEARRARKVLGGGMRQAGIIAAAGMVALEQMVDRLAEDHANARRLAEGLTEIEGLSIRPDRVQTNIVYFDLADESHTGQQFIHDLNTRGVKMLAVAPQRIRAVTHYGVDSEHIDTALAAIREVIEKRP